MIKVLQFVIKAIAAFLNSLAIGTDILIPTLVSSTTQACAYSTMLLPAAGRFSPQGCVSSEGTKIPVFLQISHLA
jgi:hypothetical protein